MTAEELMKRIVGLVVGAAAVAGVVTHIVPASGQGGGEAAPVYGIRIPEGYRDWRVISVAQVGPSCQRHPHQVGQ